MPPNSALAPFLSSQGLGVSISSALIFANGSTYGLISTVLTCAANSTNYGYLTLAPNVALAINQSGFPSSNCLPLFVAQAARDYVRNLVDYRPDWFLASGGGGGGGGSGTVASVTLQNQTASIPNTSLYLVPTSGMYAVYVDLIVTTAGTGGRVTTTISWNNGTTNSSLTSNSFSLALQGEQPAIVGNFYAPSGQTISYSSVVTGATGSPQYQLSIRLVFLG